MFTGIIEEIGTVTVHRPSSGASSGLIGIRAPGVAKGVALGDSVATQGVCLTVTRLEGEVFWVDYSATTREGTTIGGWRAGDRLNLERALTLGTRLGGHLMSGHVDGQGRLVSVTQREGVHWVVALPPDLTRYVVTRGSIAVDGVSLTVVAAGAATCDLTIIPHTWKSTTLHEKRPGDALNLEVDLIAKYVERLMGRDVRGSTPTRNGQDYLDELVRQGF